MPFIWGYPLINWYICFVLLILTALFIRIHIIEPINIQKKMYEVAAAQAKIQESIDNTPPVIDTWATEVLREVYTPTLKETCVENPLLGLSCQASEAIKLMEVDLDMLLVEVSESLVDFISNAPTVLTEAETFALNDLLNGNVVYFDLLLEMFTEEEILDNFLFVDLFFELFCDLFDGEYAESLLHGMRVIATTAKFYPFYFDIILFLSTLYFVYLIAKVYLQKEALDLSDKKYFSNTVLINLAVWLLVSSILYYIWIFKGFTVYQDHVDFFLGFLRSDAYVLIMKIVIAFTGIFILVSSRLYISLHQQPLLEFTLLILLSICFLNLLVSANDLIILFIGIIGFSLNIYVLLMADLDRPSSLEAGIKYFYLSAFSSGLLISGIWLADIIFESTSFDVIKAILESWNTLLVFEHQRLLQIMVYSIIYGFLFKLAAFPCHLWAPEIYEGSPNPIMAFFILPVKIATFAIFIRLVTNVFQDIYFITSYILWFSAWTSMLWGCLGAFTEMRVRKFIAFSSINQMGFLLIGVACTTFIGIKATLIYLLIYVIMNCAFLQIFLTTVNAQNNEALKFLTDFKYFARNYGFFAVLLIIILFSMAGIPPLAGFFGKYFLFLASLKSGYYFLVIVGMLTSLISTFYYIRIVKIMWFDEQLPNTDVILFINTMYTRDRIMYFLLINFLIYFIFISKPIFSFANLITISCLF